MKILSQGEEIRAQSFEAKMNSDSLLIDIHGSRVLSNAPLNGGLRKAGSLVNYSLYGKKDCENMPVEYLRKIIESMNIDPSNTVGLMTGVKPDSFLFSDEELVSSFLSVGNDNAASPLDGLKYSGAGTINIIVLCRVKLTDGAMVDAYKTATEAKSYSLLSRRVKSQFSERTATGTITDVTAIVQNNTGDEYRYAGTGTDLGSSISRSIYNGISYALDHFYGYSEVM